MKRNLLFCFLAASFLIQCDCHDGRCLVSEIQGFIKIMEMDTTLCGNLCGKYHYYLSQFILEDYSDTIKNIYFYVNDNCVHKKIITLDSLFPSTWKRVESGGCVDYIKINKISDTCYCGDNFSVY